MENTTDNTLEKINDKRLTPDLRRVRGGSTMQFFKPGHKTMQPEDADITIQAPRPELFAELINGEWFWVNDCPECKGEVPVYPYVKCDKHNVCVTCKTPRSKLTETPWGTRGGFECQPCFIARRELEKQEALERIAAKKYNEWDYYNMDNVVCPHCGTSYEPDCDISDDDEICELCGGEYSLKVEYSVSYTTEVVGTRITA